MSGAGCICVECRIRAAVTPRSGEAVDIGETLNALGEVTAECLAHVPTREAKGFVAEILKARKRWLRHPRVAVQKPAEGQA